MSIACSNCMSCFILERNGNLCALAFPCSLAHVHIYYLTKTDEAVAAKGHAGHSPQSVSILHTSFPCVCTFTFPCRLTHAHIVTKAGEAAAAKGHAMHSPSPSLEPYVTLHTSLVSVRLRFRAASHMLTHASHTHSYLVTDPQEPLS